MPTEDVLLLYIVCRIDTDFCEQIIWSAEKMGSVQPLKKTDPFIRKGERGASNPFIYSMEKKVKNGPVITKK